MKTIFMEITWNKQNKDSFSPQLLHIYSFHMSQCVGDIFLRESNLN